METAALSLLKRAVEMDEKKRYTEALVCYQEGIQMLLNCMRSFSDTVKRQHFREKIEMYMGRAELLKRQIEDEKSRGVYHEQILIEHNSTGHSYLSVFGRFLDSEVKEVVIEDPYIRYFHQRAESTSWLLSFLTRCRLRWRKLSNTSYFLTKFARKVWYYCSSD
ncbi:MIT domain-containing protein 1 [Homalodisca vitripennis]|nr:MIT domain-containing protein 1 [Homalodisca vitripennis]